MTHRFCLCGPVDGGAVCSQWLGRGAPQRLFWLHTWRRKGVCSVIRKWIPGCTERKRRWPMRCCERKGKANLGMRLRRCRSTPGLMLWCGGMGWMDGWMNTVELRKPSTDRVCSLGRLRCAGLKHFNRCAHTWATPDFTGLKNGRCRRPSKKGGGLGDFSKKQRSRDLDRLIWKRLLLVKVAVFKISSSKAPDLRRTLSAMERAHKEDSVKCVDRWRGRPSLVAVLYMISYLYIWLLTQLLMINCSLCSRYSGTCSNDRWIKEIFFLF